MNAHQRAKRLCIEAEKLGMDAPSESMIANEIMRAISETQLENEIELERAGFKDAARALHRWRTLQHLEEEE